jgi:hypothetical protein
VVPVLPTTSKPKASSETKEKRMKYLGPPQSGSQANTVASRNRYGQYFRTRAIPINPDTTRQSNIRAQMASVSTNWKLVSLSDRGAWNSWAQAHPVIDSLGQSQVLSAFAAFVQVNMARVSNALSLILTPPLGTLAFSYQNVTPTWVAGALSIAFTLTPSVNPASVWATGIVSSGVNVAPGPGGWRKIGTIGVGASPSVQTTGWTLTFGTPPAPGQVTFVKVAEFADSLYSAPFIRRVIAT